MPLLFCLPTHPFFHDSYRLPAQFWTLFHYIITSYFIVSTILRSFHASCIQKIEKRVQENHRKPLVYFSPPWYRKYSKNTKRIQLKVYQTQHRQSPSISQRCVPRNQAPAALGPRNPQIPFNLFMFDVICFLPPTIQRNGKIHVSCESHSLHRSSPAHRRRPQTLLMSPKVFSSQR